jgi:WhiB family redox-sensing transcriptional regulator
MAIDRDLADPDAVDTITLAEYLDNIRNPQPPPTRPERPPVTDLPELPGRRPAWIRHAACRGMDPNLWYPDVGANDHTIAAAKAVCARCPVADECLEYGLNDRWAIFGGLDQRERREIRKQRREGAA